jgi:hypothetical protein
MENTFSAVLSEVDFEHWFTPVRVLTLVHVAV